MSLLHHKNSNGFAEQLCAMDLTFILSQLGALPLLQREFFLCVGGLWGNFLPNAAAALGMLVINQVSLQLWKWHRATTGQQTIIFKKSKLCFL